MTIHGGTRARSPRDPEAFTHDPDVRVLVATDAAGEGLNLQAAHLMINYDLPWNPNRIEQRFGRIHRIGQKQVCRLWNLVADRDTAKARSSRLLTRWKPNERPTEARLFDVLGEAFKDQPLSKLLMEAVRCGDDPARQAELRTRPRREVSKGTEDLLRERALARGH